MPTPLKHTLLWTPRLLGLCYVAFLSAFSFDVFSEGLGLAGTVAALSMHLIPSAVMLLVVIIAWKHELAGVVLLVGAAGIYAFVTRQHPSWILVIAGPLVLLAILFALSWWQRQRSMPR